MNWSSENLMRGRVLRDWDVDLEAIAGAPAPTSARSRRARRAASS